MPFCPTEQAVVKREALYIIVDKPRTHTTNFINDPSPVEPKLQIIKQKSFSAVVNFPAKIVIFHKKFECLWLLFIPVDMPICKKKYYTWKGFIENT